MSAPAGPCYSSTMPIYEYTCKSCHKPFEKLVRSMNDETDGIPCPACGSKQTERALSVFAVSSTEGGAAKTSLPAAPGCGRCGGPGPCAMG